MRKLFIISFLLIAQQITSQNLVPNKSFEDTVSCPTGTNNTQAVANWFNPTGASPDYFNRCASSTSGAGTPFNSWGHQIPFNGNAYIGLATYVSPSILPEYREYMEVQLLAPLTAGKEYHWCMWVSLQDSTNLASNNIGLSLSDTMVTAFTSQTILNSTVYFNHTQIIIKSNGWTELAGSFIAQGGEEFLILGNFLSDAQTNTFQVRQNTLNGETAGYYIDNINLSEISCFGEPTEVKIKVVANIPNVFTPNEDGNNDLFKLEFPFNKVEIFNRWGQQLFKTKDNNSHWDGRTTSGTKVPNGVYYYVIETEDKTYKGYLELLR